MLPSSAMNWFLLAVSEMTLVDGSLREEHSSWLDLVLGPDGPQFLTPSQRRYLTEVGKQPMGLYEIQEVLPGFGFRMRSLLEDDSSREVASEDFHDLRLPEDMVAGARLIPGEPWTLSGMLIPIQRETAEALAAGIRGREGGFGPREETRIALSKALLADLAEGFLSAIPFIEVTPRQEKLLN